MPRRFNLQGHRGARGLKPENTLPSFEAALDLGVTSFETDVHLTRDGVPVLFHDPAITAPLCQRLPGSDAPDPMTRPLVRSLTLHQLRGYRADGNPDPQRFPAQDPSVTPLAEWFAQQHGLDPYTPPTVADLFAFVEAYAGQPGARAGKTVAQQGRARQLCFDLELKRTPFFPEWIADDFDGQAPALLEQRLLDAVRAAGVLQRTAMRSFDHRCVRALRQLEPALSAAVLIAETAPIFPALLVRQADAQMYCPSFDFLDEAQIRHLADHGVQVVPWTVNEPAAWQRLLDWGVDGITTDFPDQLAEVLRRRGIEY